MISIDRPSFTVYHDFYKSLPFNEDSENVLLNTETETASTTMETQSSDARMTPSQLLQ